MKLTWWQYIVWISVHYFLRILYKLGLLTSIESEGINASCLSKLLQIKNATLTVVYSLRLKSSLSRRSPSVIQGENNSCYTPASVESIRIMSGQSRDRDTSIRANETPVSSSGYISNEIKRKFQQQQAHYGLIDSDDETICADMANLSRSNSTGNAEASIRFSISDATPIKRVSFNETPSQERFVQAMMASIESEDDELNEADEDVSMISITSIASKLPKRTDLSYLGETIKIQNVDTLDIFASTRALLEQAIEYKAVRDAALLREKSGLDSQYAQLMQSERERKEQSRAEALVREKEDAAVRQRARDDEKAREERYRMERVRADIETEKITAAKAIIAQEPQELQEVDSSSLTGPAATVGAVAFEFAHIRQAETRMKWLTSLRLKCTAENLSNDLKTAITQSLPRILQFDNQINMDNAQSIVYKISTEVLVSSNELDDNSLMFILSSLLQSIIDKLTQIEANAEQASAFAFIIQGIYFGLGDNLKIIFVTILIPIMNLADRRCIPDFGYLSSGDLCEFSALASFLGTLIETEVLSVLNASYGWSWLVRACKQLQVLIDCDKPRFESGCLFIATFLRYSHSCIRRAFGSKFTTLLHEIDILLSQSSKNAYLNVKHILDGSKICSDSFCGYPPQVLRQKILIGSLRRFVEGALAIESTSADDMQRRVRNIGLDQLDGEFNKLGPSPESQQRVITGIITIANSAGNDTSLVNYVLFKVSKEIVNRSMSQFFSISAGHALPLARIVCELCKVKKDIGDLIKAQFYIASLLTVPNFEEGCNLGSDSYFQAMGYEKVFYKNDVETWETSEKWASRQMKVVVTYFTVMIQSEGYPLRIEDGYVWLTSLINSIRASLKPPSYVASLLDHVLRTISPALKAKYGQLFLDILKIIQTQIVPRLDCSIAKSKIEVKRLLQFLNHVELNGGNQFLSL